MANQSGSKTDGNRAANTASADDAGSGCRADDLRGLLERITQQIADSEQRQSDTLSHMLGRLDALGAEARSYRGRVPANFLPAFERIEDGVNMLAERIASVRDDSAPMFVEQPHAGHAPTAATTEPTVAPAPVAEPASAHVASVQPAVAPLPLYDFDAVMPNDENAWDHEAAEALARHYEANAVGYTGPTPAPERKQLRCAAAAPQQPQQQQPRGLDVERGWLEERFADIAQRIEASLADSAPDTAFSSFGDRFDQLEQRFGTALDGVAQRADVEGLRILEAHITELTQQFDETRSQLGRLDGIEQTLSAVVDRLTDPRFDDILARGGGATGTDLEPLISAAVEQIASRLETSSDATHAGFAELADAAAERVATRFADLGQGNAQNYGDNAASGEMSTIRQLLEHFINERREGDEQTAAMLDTMQQAMIRMLDRVDNIEVAQSKTTPQEYVREQVRFGVDAASGATSGAHKAADAASAFAAEARGTVNYEPRKPAAPTGGAAEEVEFSARPFVQPAPTAAPRMPTATEPVPMSSHPMAQAAGPAASATNRPSASATIERLRSDFIADAQRAKQKAAAAAAADEGEAGSEFADRADAAARTSRVPINDSAPSATVSIAKARAKQAAPAAAEGRRISLARMPSRKILVSALVLLVAIPGLIMLAQKRAARSAAAVPTAAKIEAPAATKSMSAAPAADTTKATRAETGATREPKPEPAAARAEPDERNLEPIGDDKSAGDSPERKDDVERSERDRQRDLPRSNVDQVGQAEMPAGEPNEIAEARATVEPAAEPAAAPVPYRTSAADLSMPAAPVGIHVATPGKAPTLEQLQRLQQRQSMAELSSKLGAAQPANATLASLIPDAAAAAAGIAPPQNAEAMANGAMSPAAGNGMATRKALDMPPAAIGPMSLRMAAANGDASAEFEVGARFAEGNGIGQNFAEAARWYQRSATQGFAQAQYRLATLYERGLGVQQDVNRAKVWYGRSAEAGNVKAMHNLAVLSAGRTAKTPDYVTAATWFEAAAERGLADSQFNLAVLYDSGLGVAKDQKTAYKWFALAARGGDQEAVRRRDDMERSMVPADLAIARKAVSAWNTKAAEKIANDARAAGEDWKNRARASGDI